MRVDIRGGLIVCVSNDLHCNKRIDAGFVKQSNEIMPKVVRSDRRFQALANVVGTICFFCDLSFFNTVVYAGAASQSQIEPRSPLAT